MKIDSRVLSRIALAIALACIALPSAQARTVKQKKQAAKAQFEVAERLRDSLLGTPDSDRERRDYQKVMDAYRKVYYTAPSWAKADEAVLAVAELLDDQGRVFNEPKDYKDAIGQLAFLRREYPGSRHRVEALFTIAQIYRDDLNDQDQARATFQDFLKHYPGSTLAPKAKRALAEIGNAEVGGDPFKSKSARKKHAPHTGEREAKAAWGDVKPPRPASETRRNKTEAKTEVKADAKPSKPTPESAPADDEAAAPDPQPSASDNAKQVAAEQTADAQNSSPSQQDASAPLPRPTGALPGNRLPRLTSIRHWSTPDYVRVAIDLEQEVKYQSGRVPHPDRIFFDLYGVKLAPDLVGKTFDVEAGFLHKIRVAQYKLNMARVVLDVDDVAEYSAFLLPNPYRLIIDIHGKVPVGQVAVKQDKKAPVPDVVAETAPAKETTSKPQANATEASARNKDADAGQNDVTVTNIKPGGRKQKAGAADALSRAENATAGPMKGRTEVAKADPPKIVVDDNAAIDAADTTRATTTKPTSEPTYQAVAPQQSSRNKKNKIVAADEKAGKAGKADNSGKRLPASTTHVAAPTANGERSLIRALGLKIGKIVVDAGHGGHDTGTIGPNGLEEKDLVLDVALKLGKLLENKLGAEVVYTRDDDTFIPLETRTAIANKEQADLFISIHANSSSDESARGIETYYLNFTQQRDALEVAARENAVSEKSIHELQDLVKKIALKEKIEESREFAADVQKSLYTGLNARNPGLRNRGVKKAPFIVLIGANMPSILAEISFVSNPHDEKKLKTSAYRQQIADSLYKGVASYINGLSGVKVAAKLDRHDASSSVASAK